MAYTFTKMVNQASTLEEKISGSVFSYKTRFSKLILYRSSVFCFSGIMSLQTEKHMLYNFVQFALDSAYKMCYDCIWPEFYVHYVTLRAYAKGYLTG